MNLLLHRQIIFLHIAAPPTHTQVECNSIHGNRSLYPVRNSVSTSLDLVANNRQISMAADESG